MKEKLTLSILPQNLAVCRLDPQAIIPPNILQASFFALTRTDDEISIVLPEEFISPEWQVEKDWRAFKVEGPLDFALIGILADISSVLSQAGVSIFAISTYDTDYVLVKADKLDEAKEALTNHNYLTKE